MPVFSASEKGQTVAVRSGETLTLRLPENPTTGYRWEVESFGSLKPVGDAYEGGGASPGSAGARSFQWVAAPGVHQLALVLRREWAPSDQPLERFAMTVRVE
jgi:inhibitor of cysteine peptidase